MNFSNDLSALPTFYPRQNNIQMAQAPDMLKHSQSVQFNMPSPQLVNGNAMAVGNLSK
jgi:hypothetical protein